MTEIVFCYVTCPDFDEARSIARALVEERLAACGNIVPGMTSIYRWRGAVHQAEEALLVLKTRADLADRLTARVSELHRYECPCVAVLPVTGGSPVYLAWIAAETGDPLDCGQ